MISRATKKVVHKETTPHGTIKVVDTPEERLLYLDSDAIQSAMSLSDPVALQLSYTRAMMSFLLFCPAPKRILLIGLGGGSLAKFLLRYLPDSRIDVIENNPAMTHIAHDYFALPDSDRLSLHYGDGGDVVEQLRHRGEKRYDAILVDAYDGRGAAESVSSPSFFDDCRSLLGDHGIAVFNLWATQKRFYSFCVRSIENCFEGKLLKLPVPQKGNVIALACKGELPVLKRKTLHSKALLLQSQMAIEYPGFLKQIQQNNGRNPLKRLLARL